MQDKIYVRLIADGKFAAFDSNTHTIEEGEEGVTVFSILKFMDTTGDYRAHSRKKVFFAPYANLAYYQIF